MVTDINEIRRICAEMGNEELVDYYQEYVLNTYRRLKEKDGDYDNPCVVKRLRIRDALKDELLKRLGGN